MAKIQKILFVLTIKTVICFFFDYFFAVSFATLAGNPLIAVPLLSSCFDKINSFFPTQRNLYDFTILKAKSKDFSITTLLIIILFYCQFSIVHCQLSIVNCPLSIVHCQLSIVNCPLSTVHCQLSIVNCPLSTVHCQLSIVNCQLSIE
jgi:hypothetical protein